MMDEQDKLTAEIEEIDEIPAETDENVSRETENVVSEELSPKWSAEYVLTEEEMAAFIDASGVVTGKRKTTIQAGLAAVLCVINAISYATGGRKMALFLAIVCGVLCGAVLIVPMRLRKQMLEGLKAAATEENPTRLSCDGASLSFGAGEDTLSYAYDTVTVRRFNDFVTLLLSDGQMVCVPMRAVSDEAWEDLCAHATEK